MEMNLGTFITGIITLLLFVVPIIILNRGKKVKEKQLLQALTNLAQQYNCQIHQYELVGIYAIGIDEARNFVFFYKQLTDKHVEQAIDLGKYLSCSVKDTYSTAQNTGSKYKVHDKLELVLRPGDKSRQEEIVTFYNTSDTPQLIGELQSIEKWSKLINSRTGNKT